MNETEDRLRALGGVIVPPPSSISALRRRVRRRRLRLAGSGIGLVMAVVAGAVISSQTQDDTGRLETVDEPTDTELGPGITVERLSESGGGLSRVVPAECALEQRRDPLRVREPADVLVGPEAGDHDRVRLGVLEDAFACVPGPDA